MSPTLQKSKDAKFSKITPMPLHDTKGGGNERKRKR